MSSNQRDRPLIAAIRRNDSEALQLALKHGANVNAASVGVHCQNCMNVIYCNAKCQFEPACPPPLYEASQLGCEKLVRILLDAGADAQWQFGYPWGGGLTAATVACEGGHWSIVQMLINHDRDLLEMASHRGWTPLYFASRKGHTEVCRFLLECGCNVHATTNDGKTAMMVAAEHDYFEVVLLLLGAGVDVDACAAHKRTALHHAAMSGSMDVMRELIPQNAKLCLVDGTGKTPLDLALAKGHAEAADLLLQMYGNRLSQQEEGRLVLHALFHTAKYSFAKDRDFRPPLHPLQVKIQLGTMAWQHLRKLLWSVDAEWLRRRDNRGQLPIHIACRTNAPLEVLTLLVERDPATLHMADDTGELPLHVLLSSSSFGGTSIITNTGPQQEQQQQPSASWPAVRALLQSFPGAVGMRTSAGDYPFMIAASNASLTSLTVVYEIVRANPAVVALPRAPQRPRQKVKL